MNPYRVALIVLAACKAAEPPVPRASPVTVIADAAIDAPLPDAHPDPRLDAAALGRISVTNPAGRAGAFGDHLRDVTVIAAWASWCKKCIDEMPELETLYRTEKRRDRVSIVALNVDEPEDRAAAIKAYAKAHMTVPVVFDPDAHVHDAVFGGGLMYILPATALVSRDGRLEVERFDLDVYRRLIEAALARQPHE